MKDKTYLEDLRRFFETAELPRVMHLYPYEEIVDPKKFITTHLAFVETYWGKDVARPYLRRLIQARAQLQKSNGYDTIQESLEV